MWYLLMVFWIGASMFTYDGSKEGQFFETKDLCEKYLSTQVTMMSSEIYVSSVGCVK